MKGLKCKILISFTAPRPGQTAPDERGSRDPWLDSFVARMCNLVLAKPMSNCNRDASKVAAGYLPKAWLRLETLESGLRAPAQAVQIRSSRSCTSFSASQAAPSFSPCLPLHGEGEETDSLHHASTPSRDVGSVAVLYKSRLTWMFCDTRTGCNHAGC